MNIYTAFPRGYCAGVKRAITLLEEIIKTYPKETIYVNHEIIHNTFVVHAFEKKGVIFGKEPEEIPTHSIVVISAHGTGPEYMNRLHKAGVQYIDATCPLVTKVHTKLQSFIKEGYQILYIGKKGHQEAEGILEEDRENIFIISGEADISSLLEKGLIDPLKKYALLNQTTLSVDETQKLSLFLEKTFPYLVVPKASDICYATTNRQAAIKLLAHKCDTIVIVGSAHSSNSNKLATLARNLGKKAYLIDSAQDLEREWFKNSVNIGISSGASVPEYLVDECKEVLESYGAVFQEELVSAQEKMDFGTSFTLQYA